MSEPKWTPGPWRANGADVQLDRFNVSIAHCAEVGLPAEANAHLIAAAPDLYEAVALLLSSHHPDPDVVERRVIEGLNIGLAALAKARGKP